jgi:hypothetical protein
MNERVTKLPKRVLLIVCLLGLAATHCDGDGSVIECINNTTCVDGAAGRCADRKNSKCIGVEPDKECLYALKISTAGCVCIEGDVKICELKDTSYGVKMCEAEPSNTTGTRWGECQRLNPVP